MRISQIKKSSVRTAINVVLSLPIFIASLLSSEQISDFTLYAVFVTVSIGLLLLVDYRILKGQGQQPVLVMLPAIYMLGFLGVVAAVSSDLIRVLLGLAASILFYFYQKYFPKNTPHFLEDLFNLVTALGILSLIWALNFFFALSWGLLLLAVFIFSTLLIWQAFYKMNKRDEELRLTALLSGLIVTEVSWATLYLPVHFLSSAVIGFAGLYLIYMLSHLYFRGKLTRDKIYFQVGLIAIVLFLVLISSPWAV